MRLIDPQNVDLQHLTDPRCDGTFDADASGLGKKWGVSDHDQGDDSGHPSRREFDCSCLDWMKNMIREQLHFFSCSQSVDQLRT